MARKVSGGLTGSPSVGAINVAPTAVVTAATNQDITLSPAGTGSLVITANAQLQAQSDLRFADADSSNYVAFQAPSTISTNYTLTLPAAVAGTSGFALTSDTDGNLSWSAVSAALTDNNSDSGTNYLVFTTSTSGNLTAARVATTTRTLSYQPSTGILNATGITASTLTVTGNTEFTGSVRIQEFVEDIVDAAVGTNTATISYTDGSVFFATGTPSGNITVNLTNAPTTDGRTFVVSLVVTQGATGRIPSTFQIGGVGQTIRWAFGITPTATANKIDIFNFQLIRRSGAWTVLGSANTNF
jgi:hypothetical protein